ncbi:MAG: hypothetical protein QOG82_2549 [Actinomycetota bacterium]|nr:hypothetical protein [Actinomycetota bacterium]
MTSSPDQVLALIQLAEGQRAAGRMADADRTFRQAIEAARHELGDGHPTTTRLRARLTRLLIDLGRDAEAAGLEAGRGNGHQRGDDRRRYPGTPA